jgi:hypothetical protein
LREEIGFYAAESSKQARAIVNNHFLWKRLGEVAKESWESDEHEYKEDYIKEAKKIVEEYGVTVEEFHMTPMLGFVCDVGLFTLFFFKLEGYGKQSEILFHVIARNLTGEEKVMLGGESES